MVASLQRELYNARVSRIACTRTLGIGSCKSEVASLQGSAIAAAIYWTFGIIFRINHGRSFPAAKSM